MASQRLSRGFHRLGVFLAAIPLLFGVGYSLGTPYQMTNNERVLHERVTCAHGVYQNNPKLFWTTVFAPTPPGQEANSSLTIDLQTIGCSSQTNDTVLVADATKEPPAFNWWASYAGKAGPALALAAALALALYGLVRAIGWVIGGFAS